MTTCLERRTARLEAELKPVHPNPFATLTPDDLERLWWLTCKDFASGLTPDERAEETGIYASCGLERDNTGFPPDGWLEGMQEAIDKAAERHPKYRAFASHKTWVGDWFSPRQCGHWRGQVQEADPLPQHDRERAIELLRLRSMNYRLDPAEVDWLEELLLSSGLDLGQEGEPPWLRDHLADGFGPYVPPGGSR